MKRLSIFLMSVLCALTAIFCAVSFINEGHSGHPVEAGLYALGSIIFGASALESALRIPKLVKPKTVRIAYCMCSDWDTVNGTERLYILTRQGFSTNAHGLLEGDVVATKSELIQAYVFTQTIQG